MRISHYKVVDFIGAGGMGAVLRAVDERLGRTVAVKVLPERDGDGDPDRELRLLREAQAASALNHPGIVTLHDVGTHEGRPFLVMEYVEGECFSELVGKELATSEALLLCAEAADALAVAHQHGILHRDVKSDNLMRTRDGRVKVLDFGLAKLLDDGAAAGDAASPSGPTPATEPASPTADDHRTASAKAGKAASEHPELAATVARATSEPSAAPADFAATLASGADQPDLDATRPISSERSVDSTLPSDSAIARAERSPSEQLTRLGQIVGTPAYMSPEQASGHPLDPKSEIFSLAIVAYELVAGERPFTGSTTLDEALETIRQAKVAPPSRVSGHRLDSAVDAVLLKALAREPGDRYPDMAAFATALRHAASAGRRRRRALIVAAAIALLGALTLILVALLSAESSPRSRPAPSISAETILRPTTVRRLTLDEGCEEFPTFSPDGDRLIFNGTAGSRYALFSLDLASGERRQLMNAEGWEFAATLSPDGAELAFLRRDKVSTTAYITDSEAKRAPRAIAKGRLRPAWSPDGSALWAGETTKPTRWDAKSGAATRTIEAPPGMQLLHVRELDDGRVVGLPFPADASSGGKGIVIYPAADAGAKPQWLVEFDNEEVLAIVDNEVVTTRLATAGTVELWRIPVDGGEPSVVPGSGVAPRTGLDVHPASERIAWSDCKIEQSLAMLTSPTEGAPLRPIPLSQGSWADFEPMAVPGSDRAIIISDRGGPSQIWEISPGGTGAARPLPTSGLTPSSVAVSPDGKQIAFAAEIGLYIMPRDASALPRQLVASTSCLYPSFTRDGKSIVFENVNAADQPRINIIDIDGSPARLLLDLTATEPMASPTADEVAFVAVAAGATEDGVPMLLDLNSRRHRPVAGGLEVGWYHNLRFSPDGTRLTVLRGGTYLFELVLASGEIMRTYDAGVTQFMGVTYFGDDLLIGLNSWTGSVWLGEPGTRSHP